MTITTMVVTLDCHSSPFDHLPSIISLHLSFCLSSVLPLSLSLFLFWSSFLSLYLSFSPSYINQSHFNPSHSLPPLSHYLHLIHIRFILDVMTRWRNRLIFLLSFSTCFKKQESRDRERESFAFFFPFRLRIWWWSVSCSRIRQWTTFLK